MCGDELVGIDWVHHITYLWTSINFIQASILIHIPYSYWFISRSTTCGQNIVLMGWPGQCLNCSSMLIKFMHDLARPNIIYGHQVIITPWGHHITIKWPLHPTHLLFMSSPFIDGLPWTNIPYGYSTIFGTTYNKIIVAVDCADSAIMVPVFAYFPFFLYVDHA